MLNKDIDHYKRVKQVSRQLGIPEEVVELALHYTSEYIKNKIGQVELDTTTNLTEEEFNKKYPTIKLPGSVGYLKPSFRKYNHINKKNNKQ